MKVSPLQVLVLSFLFASGCTQPNDLEQSLPNILLAIADDVSYPHMGAYGTTWVETPAFDWVADEGLLFQRAYTPNAKCAPSRSILLTGRNSWQLEEAANHWPYFPEKFKTYAEAFSEAGFHVGYTAKGWAPGVALDPQGNRRQLAGKAYNDFSLEPPADHISRNDYARNFEDFLDEWPGEKPFVFWYGSLEPHRAYEFGASLNKGPKQLSDIDRVPAFWPDNDSTRTDMLDYAFEIEHFDSHLMRMLRLLEERGELDNTLVVVTADNGMPFPRVKGQSYEMSNHLPFAVRWPAGIKNPGRIVSDFISFIDVAPTFFEILGMDPVQSGMQPVEGKSLLPLFKDEAANAHRTHVLIGKERHDVGRPQDGGYPMRGIVKDKFLYIQNYEPDRWPSGNPETGYLNCDGSPTKSVCLNARRTPDKEHFWQFSFGKRASEELFNIEEDPDCIHNLSEIKEYAKLKEDLRSQMLRELTEQEDPRVLGQGFLFDDYLYADEQHQGFYEKYMAGETLNAGWVNESDFEPIIDGN